jgi:AraC family transcriptional regulator, alkane utilization regulator
MADVPVDVLSHSPVRAPEPDPLANALECLALRSWIPGRFELTVPWGLQVATHVGWFYLSQEPYLLTAEAYGSPLAVAAGDLIVVTQSCAHCMRDAADSAATPIQSLLGPRHFEHREPLVHGGGGAQTRLFCGCFFLEGLERSPLHAAWPAVIRIRGQQRQPSPYVDHLLRLLDLEASVPEPGARINIDRLVRILLIKAIRSYLSERPPGDAGWLNALADPDIGRALALMHAQPDVPWPVVALAKQVAMARSTFSARFTAMVGKPPLKYLNQWRMQKAGFLLRTTRAELKEVAARVGYESHSAFSKAFTRWAGATPGVYRRARETAAVSPPCVPPLNGDRRPTATSVAASTGFKRLQDV